MLFGYMAIGWVIFSILFLVVIGYLAGKWVFKTVRSAYRYLRGKGKIEKRATLYVILIALFFVILFVDLRHFTLFDSQPGVIGYSIGFISFVVLIAIIHFVEESIHENKEELRRLTPENDENDAASIAETIVLNVVKKHWPEIVASATEEIKNGKHGKLAHYYLSASEPVEFNDGTLTIITHEKLNMFYLTKFFGTKLLEQKIAKILGMQVNCKYVLKSRNNNDS